MTQISFPFKAKSVIHRGESRIALQFERKPEHITALRALTEARWSATMRCWHVPDTPTLKALFLPESVAADATVFQQINEQVQILKRRMQSDRYSENSIKTYTEALGVFLRYYKDKDPRALGVQDVIDFNNDYILRKGLSLSYQNQMVNAIKLYWRIIEKDPVEMVAMHRPRREHKLPNVLSKKEVRDILRALGNMKHRTMLSLIYSCGLRCGELLRLKAEHIDSQRQLLWVKQSKGKKDRVVPLSMKTIEMLREYYVTYRPKFWLFEGQEAGQPYAQRSLQLVLKQAVAKAGIRKPVTLHWLRHSYATHLLESGTDLRYIQEILGHNSSRTTEIYTHVSTRSLQNIVSPFDSL